MFRLLQKNTSRSDALNLLPKYVTHLKLMQPITISLLANIVQKLTELEAISFPCEQVEQCEQILKLINHHSLPTTLRQITISGFCFELNKQTTPSWKLNKIFIWNQKQMHFALQNSSHWNHHVKKVIGLSHFIQKFKQQMKKTPFLQFEEASDEEEYLFFSFAKKQG